MLYRTLIILRHRIAAALVPVAAALLSPAAHAQSPAVDIPDSGLAVAYQRAALQNVLAAVNPNVFVGYFSVCADGHGFGYGYTYPSLDGHQMSDALLWLNRADVVRANWEYVKSFQREDGLLPLAIFPGMGGKDIGPKGYPGIVAPNGGLYVHWVPGNPLEALASPTYIQNADVIYRATLDTAWLIAQLPSINRSADFLASLTTPEGEVRGGGYYVERPPRLDADGVTQCYAVDAFTITASLNHVAGNDAAASRYDALAARIRNHFVSRFWAGGHFAEYINPVHGAIANHGLTDVDWAAIATGVATPGQVRILWPQLRDEKRFHYGGMPTGIATHPEKYDPWEFNYDRHDLAAMGRVWYLEAWARARMGDARGLIAGLRKVSQVGRDSGYYWRERYVPDEKGQATGIGPNTYCEYPANLIRITQRFLMGVDLQLDGTVALAPLLTREFWARGVGQTLSWRGRTLRYHVCRDTLRGTYTGSGVQRVGVRFPEPAAAYAARASVSGTSVPVRRAGGLVFIALPPSPGGEKCSFALWRQYPAGKNMVR